jgi:hypothetical protein
LEHAIQDAISMHAMNRATRHFVLLTALAVVLAPAQSAGASALDVVQDCADSNSLEGSYSDRELRQARGQVPSDLDEYSDCSAIIAAAIGKGGPKAKASGDGGSGAAPADANGDGRVTPAEKRAATKRKQERQERRQLASLGDDITPDGASALTSDDSSDGTPLPLVLSLIALLCLGAGAGVWYAARRNPAVANALRRVPLPGKRG